MRPIFFEEENDKLMENSETYLWGKDFLVTPILKDSVKTKAIYFPKTANWFNFYVDEKIVGGQTKNVTVKQNAIPTYVRGGVLILMVDVVQTTENYNAKKLELHYYFDASVKESEREFYNDDGLTANAFEKEQYEILEFEAEISRNWLEIDFEARFGVNWKPSTKEITLVVHNVNWKPKKVYVDGKKLKIKVENNRLKIPIKWNPKKELEIKIKRK